MTLAARRELPHAWGMNDLALRVRTAQPSDAADLARIYIDSWQDTYAGLMPHSMLKAMSLSGHTARWQAAMRGPGTVLVAEDADHGPIGLTSCGAARDDGLGFDGEIYTLYVDPSFIGRGTGKALLAGAFDTLKDRKLNSCLIWAHAQNNACFFYEAMGGRRIATRTTRLMGEQTPETGYGWKSLAAARQDRPVKS
jgi:GNAT superfamily N-acetyltransferase